MLDQDKSVLEKNWIEKIHRLQAAGIEVYPTRASVTHTSVDAINEFEETENNAPQGTEPEKVNVIIAGRLRSMRLMGKIIFAHLEDGYGRI